MEVVPGHGGEEAAESGARVRALPVCPLRNWHMSGGGELGLSPLSAKASIPLPCRLTGSREAAGASAPELQSLGHPRGVAVAGAE